MSSSAFTPTTTQVTTEVPVNVPVVTAWTAYTPATITGYTTSSSLYEWRRLGDTIQVRGRFLTASTSATAASFTLPSGLTARSVTVQTNGLWTRATTASSQIKTGHLYSTNGSNVINFSSGNFSTSDNPQSTFNGSGWGGAGEVIVFDVWAVINEWAGSGTTTLADRAVEEFLSHNGTSQVNGPDGAIMPTTTPAGTSESFTITTSTPVLSTDSFVLEFQRGGVGGWFRSDDRVDTLRFDGTNFIGAGVYFDGTNITLIRGKYKNGVTSSWSGVSGEKWRVRKVSSGAQVGYPISTKNIVGATDGVAPVTGMLGERLDGTWLNPSNAVGIKNAFSINLTSGTWMIYGKVYMQSLGATGYIDISCSISTVSNTSDNSSSLNTVNSTVSRDVICASLPRCLTVSGPTPVYFVVSNSLGGGSFSAGWLQAASYFFAVRIA